jgi:eukaryotic-like serine/threonine-protein kinase
VSLQVLFHISERLVDLHESGFVHRDVKPGNILWLHKKKQWTLIDFGCVARKNEVAKKGFTLMYAAPEVVIAAQAKDETIVATEALDAWSVGILAIQMFAGKIPFDLSQQRSEVSFRLAFHLAKLGRVSTMETK